MPPIKLEVGLNESFEVSWGEFEASPLLEELNLQQYPLIKLLAHPVDDLNPINVDNKLGEDEAHGELARRIKLSDCGERPGVAERVDVAADGFCDEIAEAECAQKITEGSLECL